MTTTTTWQIGESGTSVALDDQGRGEVTFTVTNGSAQQDRAVLTITALDGAAESWFEVEEPQRAVGPGASVVYRVTVTVPPGTAPGVYAFQAVAYSADRDPGESSATSKRVTVEVKASAPPPPGFPKWIFLVIAAVVLVVAVVLWLILSGGGGGLEAEQQPAVTGTAEVGQTLDTTLVEWSEDDVEVTIQWERCNADGEDCTAVDGATNLAYPVGNEDVGSRIRVTQTATAGDDTATASSEPTSAVPEPPPVEPVLVPGVVGRFRSQAIAALSPTFVVVVLEAGDPSGTCDPIVEDQNPPEGTFVTPGEEVTIVTRPRLSLIQCLDFDDIHVGPFPFPLNDAVILRDTPPLTIPDELFDEMEELGGPQAQP